MLPVNYYTPLIKNLFSSSTLNISDQTTEQRAITHESNYYNNKILSEEGNYTAKRQQEGGMIGNHLEKPPIFLKR